MFFRNGTEHIYYEECNCFGCLNYRSIENKKPLCLCTKDDECGGFGCVLMDVHFMYQNDKQKTELSQEILDTLLPREKSCPMRLELNELKDKINGDLNGLKY